MRLPATRGSVVVASAFRRTLLLLALTGVVTLAQQPPAPAPATLTVSGVVTTVNDTPLPRARVSLADTASTAPVLTDERGQFQIRVPNAASATLTFGKTGYLTFVMNVPTRVSSERDTGLRVRLVRAGAISGRALDQRGSPLRLTVTARRAGAPSTSKPLSTMTNDLGEYRFGGLSEGAYVISARPPSEPVGGPSARWVSGSQWVKTARPAQDGTFRIPGLPPGDYLIAVTDRTEAGSTYPDPGLLESLSFRATRISLNEGQTQDVSLRLIRR